MDAKQARENSHRFRNQLNQFLLEASLFSEESLSERKPLRQLERLESLERRLRCLKADLKCELDPEWLESVTRILIVEDNGDQRSFLANALRKRGYFVATAANGNEAIEYLHEEMSPDIVLMDINMPDCDGSEVSRIIHFAPFGSNTHVIAVTAASLEHIDASSFSGYFQKPVCIDSLDEHIRRLTTDASAAQEASCSHLEPSKLPVSA